MSHLWFSRKGDKAYLPRGLHQDICKWRDNCMLKQLPQYTSCFHKQKLQKEKLINSSELKGYPDTKFMWHERGISFKERWRAPKYFFNMHLLNVRPHWWTNCARSCSCVIIITVWSPAFLVREIQRRIWGESSHQIEYYFRPPTASS